MSQKISLKPCGWQGCKKEFRQYRSTDKYCSWGCSNAAREAKEDQTPKKRKPIKNISTSRIVDLATYRPIRDSYLSEHTQCEVRGCVRNSTNLHHKAGRQGYADQWARDSGIKLLWDVRYFMACCEKCHPKRIHEDPEWARVQGYILTL